MVPIMKSSSRDILDDIIHIYDDLRNNNIILVHHGAFTQDIILSLLSLTKERLMFVRDKKIVRKKSLTAPGEAFTLDHNFTNILGPFLRFSKVVSFIRGMLPFIC